MWVEKKIIKPKHMLKTFPGFPFSYSQHFPFSELSPPFSETDARRGVRQRTVLLHYFEMKVLMGGSKGNHEQHFEKMSQGIKLENLLAYFVQVPASGICLSFHSKGTLN